MDAGQQGFLARSSLRGDAARAIQAQIVSGTIEPEKLYSIGEIAAQLGTSPTPVREALIDLAHKGLIETVRNRGFRVRTLSDHDLQEIVEMRLLLEVYAMQRLAASTPRADLSRARALALTGLESARKGDLQQFLGEDRDFHLSLISLTGNSRLTEVVGNLRDQTRLYGISRLEDSALLNSAVEHLQLLDDIEKGDVEAAGTTMRQHLQHILGDWGHLPITSSRASEMPAG